MRALVVVGLLVVAGQARAGALDLLSPKAVEYIQSRAKEARVGYTLSFDGTSGGSVYLPVRWLPSRLLELGVGYHRQEGGVDKPFAFAGADLQALYRASLKRLPLFRSLQGPPLPPLYISSWVNAYSGHPWVVGREAGVQVSVEVFQGGS